ncbi:MAG TPA: hypothetical protein VNH44_11545 [Micropepsaceae bacterium]|nr:hypothetical protein [Micropepsaceae bacterium]
MESQPFYAQPEMRTGTGRAGGDFSRVPIHRPSVVGSGLGGKDPLQPTGKQISDAPVLDTPTDVAPVITDPAKNNPAQSNPVQTNPAQGGAVPMAQVAVNTLTANIGPDGLNIAHVPPCGNQPTIRFVVTPRSAAPVTWSITAGSPAAGTTLTPAADTLSATLSLGPAQKGGELDIKAENNQGGMMLPYRLASHPTGIASTTAIGDPTDSSLYGGVFDHVFTSNDGQTSSLDQVAVGEKFPNLPTPNAATHTFQTVFGQFTLKTGTLPNTPAAGNWFLTSGGELGDDHDTVGIQKSLIDIGRHLASDSNPTPAHPMPAGFTVDQEFHWWCPHAPAGSRWTHAADTTHERTLRMDKSGTGAEFVAVVNGKENAMAYDGDPAIVKTGVTNAKADPATVAPSAAGGTPNTVQISADLFPSGRTSHFSIIGNAHGCTINSTSGELTIGTQTGVVKVRVANVSGGPNWDEVDVTIAAPAASKPPVQNPAPNPTPHAGGEAPPADH